MNGLCSCASGLLDPQQAAVPAIIQPTGGFGETSRTCRGTRAPPGEQLDGMSNVGLGAERLKEKLGRVLV